MIFPIFSYTFQIEAETQVSASKSFMRFFMSNFIGLYIHIPFCKHKCPYCDFFSGNADENAFDNYVIELKDKIKKEQQIQELTKASKGISGTKTKLEQRLEHEQNVDEAMSALQVLGFNKKEIEKALDKLVTEEMSTEEIIRKALSILGK